MDAGFSWLNSYDEFQAVFSNAVLRVETQYTADFSRRVIGQIS